jgi:hypothetical protein
VVVSWQEVKRWKKKKKKKKEKNIYTQRKLAII